ncbi:MAG: dTMP kinase [Euryarchaeota archaeon]|nr:dTMP kinase [Euryarchaeota archaeon]
MFIVLEGIDGTGKTTIANKLADELKSQGYSVFLTQEPTNTWIGKDVRRAIEEEKNGFTQALLFFADRAEHIEELKKNGDKIIICDRYVYSTFAYQSVQLKEKLGISGALDWFRKIYAPMRFDPDLVFLITVDPEEGIRRIYGREKKEKFEKVEFLREVQDVFIKIADEYGFIHINGNQELSKVYSAVHKKVMEKIKSL